MTRRPGETAAIWRARTRQVQDWHKLGTSALRAGDFSTAIARFEMILREEPGYLNTEVLLGQARDGRQTAARQVLDEAARTEQAGDYIGAIRLYDQARGVDPSMPGIDDAIRQARGKATAEGQTAYGRARQYDALGRVSEAITQYERAAQLLPADDPLRKAAKDRAVLLRAGGK